MSYDYDYFSGKHLKYPAKPHKPPMWRRNPTAIEARMYADAMELYERELDSYKEDRSWYESEKRRLNTEFQNQVRDDYDITQTQFDLLWRKAEERAYSSDSLEETVMFFDELYDLATEFAALEG